MKKLPKLADERYRYTLQQLQLHGSCKVSTLASELGVSEMTIHRDLVQLAKVKLLRKVHGGAVLLNYIEQTFQDRTVQNHEAKVAIAQQAMTLVRPHSSIYLAPGTTAHELALLLNQEGLEVYTNSLPTATALARSSQQGIGVTLLGGRLVGFVEAVAGPVTEAALANLKFTAAFIAVTGVSLEGGLTVYTEEEARVIRCVIRAARTTVLITDKSKYDLVVGPQVSNLEEVHTVIADGMPDKYQHYCQEHDVQVLLCDVPSVAKSATQVHGRNQA